jgi:hypothetical protein
VGSWRRPGAGELVIRHRGREVSLALRCDEPSETMFAAFYADCLHEVLPVTSGCRLTLVYNLLRKEKGPPPDPPDYQVAQHDALALLREGPPPCHRRMKQRLQDLENLALLDG